MTGKCICGVALLPVLLVAPATGQSRVAEVRSLSMLRGATLANAEEDLGKVDDLLIQLRDGKVTSLVVTASTTAGMRTMEVPFESVTWNDTGRNFLVDMTEEELDGMPSFRRETLKPFEQPLDPEGRPIGFAPPQVGTGNMLASDIAMLKVRFLGGDEDKLRGVTVELFTGEVAFVTVSRVAGAAGMNDLHPVPWNAFRVFGVPAGPGGEAVPEATLRIDRKGLAKAPALRAGALEDPDFRTRVYKFHHVPTPRFESLH